MKVQRVASGLALEHGQAHGALLQEGRRSAALPEGGEGPDRVVAHDDPRGGEIDLLGSRGEGEHTPKGLPADLMVHVVRVREGTNDDLAGRVGPPAEDKAPAVDGGVPGDDGHTSSTGVASRLLQALRRAFFSGWMEMVPRNESMTMPV